MAVFPKPRPKRVIVAIKLWMKGGEESAEIMVEAFTDKKGLSLLVIELAKRLLTDAAN